MLSFPMTSQVKQQEWNLICTTAMNNGFPIELIQNIKKKRTKIRNQPNTKADTHRKTRITLTYQSPFFRKVTNLFKRTNPNIAFRLTNTVYHHLQNTTGNVNLNASGIY
jgi:hypothetical protein